MFKLSFYNDLNFLCFLKMLSFPRTTDVFRLTFSLGRDMTLKAKVYGGSNQTNVTHTEKKLSLSKKHLLITV